MTALVLIALAATPYSPLTRPDAVPASWDGSFTDASRSRELPVRVYLPASKAPAPVILFSHGLGGARTNSVYLGEHWASRGYVAVFLQHPGSDESVWKNVPQAERLSAMKDAASVDNALLRIKDVSVVLDALTTWNATAGHTLEKRLDLAHVGMSGHSFGAVTTQAVSGQSFPFSPIDPRERRISAAVMMSPSMPRRGDPKKAFASVAIPWLLMTGTHDEAPIGKQTAQSRLEVFPLLPPGDKYQVVFDGAEHSAFSDRALPGDSKPRNPNHHRAILALTTAFFDATLRNDAAAKAWLTKDARSVLEEKDVWQTK
ncbi:MAG: dienelactone hydrolase [Archangiaceae bacterium]|nr:dienelactone hydrolase [Archangiaceae bacterium]